MIYRTRDEHNHYTTTIDAVLLTRYLHTNTYTKGRIPHQKSFVAKWALGIALQGEFYNDFQDMGMKYKRELQAFSYQGFYNVMGTCAT